MITLGESGPAAQIRALFCGLPAHKRKRRNLMILNGFVDDSYDASVFVLAGFVAPADEWAAFSDEWEAAINAPPRIGKLKTSDAMRLKGDFYGWKPEARDEKMRIFYEIIDAHVSFGVSAVIPLGALKKVFGQGFFGKVALNPYFHAISNLVSDVARHQIKIGMEEKIDFLFDEQKMEQGKVLAIWDRLAAEAPPDVKPMLGATPRFGTDDDFLPLQAADMEAWWVRRRWQEKLTGIPRLEYPWVPSSIPEATCVHTEESLLKVFWNMSRIRGTASARFLPG
jgi:hypothetical protein